MKFWKMIACCAIIAAIMPMAMANADDGSTGVVQSAVDGDTVLLADGRSVRLLGIQAPKLSLGRASVTDWPLGNESKIFLEKLVSGKQIKLSLGETPNDRYGRTLAHLYLPDGRWVQGEIIKSGMARVYSFPDNRRLVPDLLAIETVARKNKRGIWGNDYYAVQTSESILNPKFNDTFQLVEGVVLDVAEVKKNIYLNFGADWKSDFTATIPLSARAKFTAGKIRAKDLSGKKIRVRGWVKSKNGPMIELTHPEQLEILSGGQS